MLIICLCASCSPLSRQSSFYAAQRSSHIVIISVSYASLFFSKASPPLPITLLCGRELLTVYLQAFLFCPLQSVSPFPSAFSLFCVNSWDAFVKGFHSDGPFEQAVIHFCEAVNWREDTLIPPPSRQTDADMCNSGRLLSNEPESCCTCAGASLSTHLLAAPPLFYRAQLC